MPMKIRYVFPLIGFVITTTLIGFGFVFREAASPASTISRSVSRARSRARL